MPESLTAAQIAGMIADAGKVEALLDSGFRTFQAPTVDMLRDLACHVKALAWTIAEQQAEIARLQALCEGLPGVREVKPDVWTTRD